MSAAPSPEQSELPPAVSMRRQVAALLGDSRGKVIALAIGSVLSGVAEAGTLAIFAQIAISIVPRSSGAHQDVLLNLHLTIGALFAIGFGLVLVKLALLLPLSVIPARISANVQARLRRDLFGAYNRASWAEQSSDREGHLQEIMTSQVVQASSGAQQATSLIIGSLTFVVLMGTALALNVVAAAVILVSAVLLFAALRPLNTLGARFARSLSRAQLEYAGGISEAGRLAEEAHVFGVGAAQRRRVDGFIAAAQKIVFQVQVVARAVPSVYQTASLLILLLALLGLHAEGGGHLASLGAVVLMVVRAGSYGQGVQGAYQILRQSLPFIERLQAAERRYADSSPVHGERPLPSVQTLAFEDVSFTYRAGRPVLIDVSFEMARGEAVGIIGPSGAGKSTLVQILLQLRTPDQGRYLINGVPAQEFAIDDWHRQVAYVPQEPRLVHATVAENIRFFRSLDDDAVERAGRLARIHDEIMRWPKGYETIVGPRADAVSGGQQQRICLARALAARPEVLVLDEPTSALDPHSETLIQDSLTGLKSELTVFIIAHRMSTLEMCDRVMVVVGGRLVAFDTMALLQRNNSYYQTASLIASSGGQLP
jgi:ATP-binding cassette subfamily B protein